MMELSVVIPCYEEAENLKNLLPNISEILSSITTSAEILIVDTSTPHDDTPQICAQFSSVKYVPRRGGDNYGDAVRTGIYEASGRYILFMDADCSHKPKYIQDLYQHITSGCYDVVIASRYVSGGTTNVFPLLSLTSKILNISYRLCLGLNVCDMSNSFKIYHGEQLRAISLECSNFDVIEEMLVKLKRKFNSLTIKEIPIMFTKRLHGKSKRKWVRFIISYILTLLRLKRLQHKEGD